MKALRCPYCHTEYVESYSTFGVAKCKVCKKEFSRFTEARDIFHILWTMAKSFPSYQKELWDRLRDIIGL